nr:MAG TPA: hypothetical protein [Caudoviricetes sp.]
MFFVFTYILPNIKYLIFEIFLFFCIFILKIYF